MSEPFSYPEVGATLDPARLPGGAHPTVHRERVGHARGFEVAVSHVLGFGMQRDAGLRVTASEPVAAAGVTVRMVMRLGGVWGLHAPTRVVAVVEEPDRRGFVYGTLPGHPESGEECFLVERVGEELWVEIRVFSRPARWFTRLGAPVSRRWQQRFLRRYADTVRRAVAAAGP